MKEYTMARLHCIANNLYYEELPTDKPHTLGLKLTYDVSEFHDTLTKIIYVDTLAMLFMGKTFQSIKLEVAKEFYEKIEERRNER